MDPSHGRFPNGIWLHGSAGRDGIVKDWPAIKRYHVGNKGWDDVGYHYGVELVGDTYQVMTGRGLQWQGSHVRGYNDSIGICLVGDFDVNPPAVAALSMLGKLVLGLLFTFELTPADIHFHNEVSTKTCPGLMFPEQEFIDSIRKVYNKCLA